MFFGYVFKIVLDTEEGIWLKKSEIPSSEKKFLVFIIFVALYIVLDCIDFLLTYIGTPDLAREANPLVMIYGFGWKALIISAVIYFFIFALIMYFVFVRFKRTLIPCRDFKQYLSMLYFGSPDKFCWTLYKFPKRKVYWNYFAVCTGTLILFTTLSTKLLAIVEWIGYLSNSYFIYINYNLIKIVYLGTFPERATFAVVVAIAWLAAMYLWYYREYRINKRALAQMSKSGGS